MTVSFSVIIRQLNFERITVIPAKADTVLIIYPNAMLPGSIASQ